MKNYKRFTELTIADLPETARLLVLVGPNGTGKSSVFDLFLLKANAVVNNYRLSGNTEQYYEKVLQSHTTREVASRVRIEFHDGGEGDVDWRSAFQVRSAYRNESDFRIEHLQATRPEDAGLRLARIIDPDGEAEAQGPAHLVRRRALDKEFRCVSHVVRVAAITPSGSPSLVCCAPWRAWDWGRLSGYSPR